MRKIFLMTFFIFTLITATAFAEETTEGFDYTSQNFGFKIVCPAEPVVVVNPFEDPAKRGELLVFANDGFKILYGYQILFDAFDDESTPDFNKADKETIDAYLEKLCQNNAFESAVVEQISANNKGVFAVTAKEIEVLNDAGEVEGVATASTQNMIAFFRTAEGKHISIQLIVENLDREAILNFRKSLATYRDK